MLEVRHPHVILPTESYYESLKEELRLRKEEVENLKIEITGLKVLLKAYEDWTDPKERDLEHD
jgi:hypothetical protein